MMKRILFGLILVSAPALALAAGGKQAPLYEVDINLENKESLRHGAKLFVNYCMGCHSAQYMRYNRIGEDLNIPEDMLTQNLIFLAKYERYPEGQKLKPGSTMDVAMPEELGKEWFGNPPPDLSVIARSRSPNWLYTYLKTFYVDESRQFGWNNARFPNVNMPHVMWELQGVTKANYETHEDAHGNAQKVFAGVEVVKPGKLAPEEYDRYVTDLVNFLVYVGEPAKLDRKTIGLYVIAFLLVLLVLAVMLKKEYWKDVH